MPDMTAGPLLKIAGDSELTKHLHKVIGTYCHQVRNQLNSIKLSLYFAKRVATAVDHSRWNELDSHYLDLERWLDRLQLVCRPLQLQTFPLPFGLLIEERRESWTEAARQNGGSLLIQPVEPILNVAVDLGRLGQALDDLADWRFPSAPPNTTFQLDWKQEGGFLVFLWKEKWDRPAIEPDDPIPVNRSQLSREGLTLPLILRMVSLHGGTMNCSSDVGWELSIRLPMDSG